jgi:hypothetical protein
MELREINNNRSLDPDVRIQKVIAIADQAQIAVSKNGGKRAEYLIQ